MSEYKVEYDSELVRPLNDVINIPSLSLRKGDGI